MLEFRMENYDACEIVSQWAIVDGACICGGVNNKCLDTEQELLTTKYIHAMSDVQAMVSN